MVYSDAKQSVTAWVDGVGCWERIRRRDYKEA